MRHDKRWIGASALAVACLGTMLMLLPPLPALADEASITGEGGNIYLLNGTSPVRLVEADVTVRVALPSVGERKRLLKEAALHYGWDITKDDTPFAYVDCRFVLQNTGGATTVRMGFPEESWVGSDDQGNPLEGPYPGFASFESWVDGDPWETVCSEWQVKDKLGFDRRRWRVKSVHFDADQTRVVRDAYVMELGYAGGSAYWFLYTLSTGASWKGTIGRERVTLDLSDLRAWQLVDASPRVGLLAPAKDKVVWEWHDFEPVGKTAEIRADFLQGRHAFVARLMHGWIGFQPRYVQRGKLAMAPAAALVGQYCHSTADPRNEGQMRWNPKAARLSTDGVRGGPRKVVLSAGKKAMLIGSRRVQLPAAPFVAPGPSASDWELITEGPVKAPQTLYVPLEATVRALGGHLYHLYSNGPFCLSFPVLSSGH